MNTTFQNVYDFFLSKITTYEFLNLPEVDLQVELKMNLRRAFSKCVSFKDIKADWTMEEFNRELDDLEINIISDWMVIEWIIPQVNNIEMFKQRLSSKDFNMYSQANHLKELVETKREIERNVHYWMNRYNWIKKVKEGVK